MSIWASGLIDDEEIQKAILADVKFTHQNRLVQDATFLYSKALIHLLQHPDKKNRAQKAFQLALELSQTNQANYEEPSTFESCENWLRLAKKMNEDASRYGQF